VRKKGLYHICGEPSDGDWDGGLFLSSEVAEASAMTSINVGCDKR